MTKEIQHVLDENGFALTDVSEIVDVVMRMACDESIKGRAVSVQPGTAYDMCDAPEVSVLTYQGLLWN